VTFTLRDGRGGSYSFLPVLISSFLIRVGKNCQSPLPGRSCVRSVRLAFDAQLGRSVDLPLLIWMIARHWTIAGGCSTFNLHQLRYHIIPFACHAPDHPVASFGKDSGAAEVPCDPRQSLDGNLDNRQEVRAEAPGLYDLGYVPMVASFAG
jgi:hypothetical protein